MTSGDYFNLPSLQLATTKQIVAWDLTPRPTAVKTQPARAVQGGGMRVLRPRRARLYRGLPRSRVLAFKSGVSAAAQAALQGPAVAGYQHHCALIGDEYGRLEIPLAATPLNC